MSGSPPILQPPQPPDRTPPAPPLPPAAGPPPQPPSGFDIGVRTIARTVITVLVILGFLWLIWKLRKPVSWIVIAMFIAVALSGPVNLMSRKLPRGLAILFAYLGLVLIPAGIIAIVVPPLVREGTNLANDLPDYVQDLQRWVNDNEKLKDLDKQYDIVGKLESGPRTCRPTSTTPPRRSPTSARRSSAPCSRRSTS